MIRAKVLPDGTIPKETGREIRRQLAMHSGHEVVFDIKRYYPKRSNQQNRTVRGFWVPIIADEIGLHPHDHNYLCDQIKIAIGWTEDKVNKHTGEVMKVPKPTADLDTAAYSKFMEIFRAYVEDPDTGMGILLPEPDRTKARI